MLYFGGDIVTYLKFVGQLKAEILIAHNNLNFQRESHTRIDTGLARNWVILWNYDGI